MGKKWVAFVLTLTLLFWFIMESSQAQGKREYHGADSIFEKEGIIILWAIFKGSTEETSWVYVKIIHKEGDSGSFQIFSIEAVDPFSNAKEWVVKGEYLKASQTVKSVRASFRDKTERRILLYRSKGDYQAEKPTMTVYYLGVPDTSPEFLSEKEIEDYFAKALERLKKS
jgi:hypothetical protein